MTSRDETRLSSPSWGALRSPRWRWWRERRQPEIGLRADQEDATTRTNGPGSKNEPRRHAAFGLLELRDNDTLSLRPGARGLVLRGLSGTVLVTQERDPFDHVLGPGGVFRTAGRGLVVVWALSDGAIAVDSAQAPGRESELPARRQRDAA